MNWMQALRFVAAKGHQKAIIVFRDTLQTGKYDSGLKSIVWTDYKNQKLTDTMSLRYLVRFTLVDVATGEWATRSPVNYESKVIFPQIGNKILTALMWQNSRFHNLSRKRMQQWLKTGESISVVRFYTRRFSGT